MNTLADISADHSGSADLSLSSALATNTEIAVGEVAAMLSKAQDLHEFIGSRLGLEPEETWQHIENGAIPFIEAVESAGEALMPSPLVGTLLAIAKQHGSRELSDTLASFVVTRDLSQEGHLEEYQKTISLLQEMRPEGIDPSLWPDPDSFTRSESTACKRIGYKGD